MQSLDYFRVTVFLTAISGPRVPTGTDFTLPVPASITHMDCQDD